MRLCRAMPSRLLTAGDHVIDALRHSIKVHEQAQEHLKSSGAVLVNTRQVAENCNGGHVFAVEGEYRMAHGANLWAACFAGLVGLLLVGYVALHCVVLQVVGCSNLGQQGCDHLYDVANGHAADVVLHLLERGVAVDAAGGPSKAIATGERSDMSQVSHVNDGLLLL